MTYVEGYVVAVASDKVDGYVEMAKQVGAVWKDHGALSYFECAGDDVPYGKMTSFPRAVQATENEVVFFSFITFESKEARDRVQKNAMRDERIRTLSHSGIDMKRMIRGGFEAVVEA